ncbi:MAG: hypothetical protein CMQ16_07410 [Gammaproteobacteria bacterium]|nr:hypothetical protein [Gammaproteobacteria bacterium]
MTSPTLRIFQLTGFFLWLPAINGWSQSATFSLTTNQGSALEIFSQLDPLAINTIHSWELVLYTADGAPLSGALMSVVGGMPDHDHGLPTSPVVTGEVTPGRYLLEGMRFHMPGRWLLTFDVISDQGSESATLEFRL